MSSDRSERPFGRPTKYEPRFCDEVIEAGKRGLSLTAFAGMIGVARSTINEWMAHHPDFSEATRIHASVRTFSLEEGLLGADIGPRVTARIFALKNAAPEEWSDKQHLEMTGKDGGAIKSEVTIDAGDAFAELARALDIASRSKAQDDSQ